MKNRTSTIDLARMGLMAAIVFVATFSIHIATATGYVHLGDSMVILSVMLLGTKKGAFASGVGGALADLVAGYAIWIVPTFFCKMAMAFAIGFLLNKGQRLIKGRFAWIIATVFGGIVEVIGYFLAAWILYDWAGAIGSVIGNTVQFTVGIVLAFIFAELLQKSSLRSRFTYTTYGK